MHRVLLEYQCAPPLTCVISILQRLCATCIKASEELFINLSVFLFLITVISPFPFPVASTILLLKDYSNLHTFAYGK